jgi:hypothetical protein
MMMIRTDSRRRAAGVSLGINWDVLSEMLAARSISIEVPLSAFEFLPATEEWPRRFIVHGVA